MLGIRCMPLSNTLDWPTNWHSTGENFPHVLDGFYNFSMLFTFKERPTLIVTWICTTCVVVIVTGREIFRACYSFITFVQNYPVGLLVFSPLIIGWSKSSALYITTNSEQIMSICVSFLI